MNRTPKSAVFPLIPSLEAPHDYYLYLSAITQAKYGAWLFTDPYTSETTRPGIFYLYYILCGKFAALFNLSSPLAYHLFRVFTVELFFVLIYLLANLILEKKGAFWASIFSIFGTVSPFFLFNDENAFVSYIPWWHISDSLKRMGYLPHYTFGQCLFILFSIFLMLYLSKNTRKYFFLCLFFIFSAGIFLPYVLPCAIGGLLLIIVNRWIKFNLSSKKIWLDRISRHLILIIFAGILSALLSYWQTKQGFPWYVWTSWDTGFWNIQKGIDRTIVLSFGILPILVIPSIIRIGRSKNEKLLFFAFWAFFPFIFLPFVSFLNIAKIRLVAVNAFIPFGILTSFLLFQIIKNKLLQVSLILIFFLTVLPVTLTMLQYSIKKSKDMDLYTNWFIPKPVFETVTYIKNSVPPGSVILSDEYLGLIIPAFAPVKSFFAHYNQTQNFFDKAKYVRLIYGNQWKENEAEGYLSGNNIKYIYFGPDETGYGPGELDYSFLSLVFETDKISLYKFNK